jgi:hypothetical protein
MTPAHTDPIVFVLYGIVMCAVLSVVTLVLLYSGLPLFGPVNDMINAASGVFIMVLVWQLFNTQVTWSMLNVVAVLVAWIGALLVLGNSTLVAMGQMDWKLGGMFTSIGYACLGIWLLMLVLSSNQPAILPVTLKWATLLLGMSLLSGFLAGPLLAEKISLEIKAITWLAYALNGMGWLGFPVWCWFFAQNLKSA